MDIWQSGIIETVHDLFEKDRKFFKNLARDVKDQNINSMAQNYVDTYSAALNFMETGDWKDIDLSVVNLPPSCSSVDEFVERNKTDAYQLLWFFCDTKLTASDKAGEYPYYGMPLGTIQLANTILFFPDRGFEFETPIVELDTVITRRYEEGIYHIEN